MGFELEENNRQPDRYWLEHLVCCREQNLTLAQYAKEHDLEVSKLYYWKKRLKGLGHLPSDPSQVAFARVQSSPSICFMGCRLRFPNGVMMEWDRLEGDVLVQLLPLIGRLP